MELLIRSQDKRQLLKVNDGLYIANGFTDTDDTFIGIKNVGHVGRYAKEERALEVLDEIQNILKLKDMYKYDRELVLKSWKNIDVEKVKIVREQMSVYEMPKE